MAGADSSQGEGWWLASDGKWYPPQPASSMPPPPRPPSAPGDIGVGDSGDSGSKPPFWLRGWVLMAAGVLIVLIVIGALTGRAGEDEADTATEDEAQQVAGESDDAAEANEATSTSSTTGTTTSSSTSSTTTTTSTSSSTTSSTTTTTTTQPEAEPGDRCSYLGVDSFGDMQVEVRVTSPLGTLTDLEITYGLKDAEGIRFLTDTTFIDSVYPAELLRIQADTLTSLPASVSDEAAITCEVLGLDDFGFGEAPTPPPDGTACDFIGLDFADDIQVEITTSNPFATTTDLWVDYALRGPGGVRFETRLAIVELVGPGETVRVQEDTLTDVPGWLDESDITCDILSVEESSF